MLTVTGCFGTGKEGSGDIVFIGKEQKESLERNISLVESFYY